MVPLERNSPDKFVAKVAVPTMAVPVAATKVTVPLEALVKKIVVPGLVAAGEAIVRLYPPAPVIDTMFAVTATLAAALLAVTVDAMDKLLTGVQVPEVPPDVQIQAHGVPTAGEEL